MSKLNLDNWNKPTTIRVKRGSALEAVLQTRGERSISEVIHDLAVDALDMEGDIPDAIDVLRARLGVNPDD